MAAKKLSKVFLSASIPSFIEDENLYKTADIVAIRDSIRALAAVVIPYAHLVWGGHPSITPLIRDVLTKMSAEVQQHVTIYQSRFFEGEYPKDNVDFENIIKTDSHPNGEHASALIMREAMIKGNDFKAAVFIGGMEGIFQEYDIFKTAHPEALVFPIASTGAAAKIIYESISPRLDERLINDFAYMALFRSLFEEII
jgi:hypothetical protein